MIVANLATYPPRQESMLAVVDAILPQVDRLNIVLNQYETVPLALRRDKINAILPEADLKDTGKFFPEIGGAEYVFCIDDDLIYPSDFVSRSLDLLRRLPEKNVIASFHGSLYEKPRFRLRMKNIVGLLTYPKLITDFRKVYAFYKQCDAPVIVDQAASGVCVMPASSYPGWDYMKGSEKFADVRLARWAFEKGLTPVILPREAEWLKPIRYKENIYDDFTRLNRPEVTREILTYAFKVPRRGTELRLNQTATA